MGSDPQAKALSGGVLAEDIWAAGYLGEMDGQHNPEDVWVTPVFPFEDWTLETCNVATDPIVRKLLDLAPRHKSVLGGAVAHVFGPSPCASKVQRVRIGPVRWAGSNRRCNKQPLIN